MEDDKFLWIIVALVLAMILIIAMGLIIFFNPVVAL
jgi:hypothetical protein